MHLFYKWLIGLVIIVTTMVNSEAATPDLADRERLESFVDGMVTSLMKSNDSPSGTVAITLNGEMILAKGYGFENAEQQRPVNPYETLFRPGSVSKLFTWVAVMQLVEQGKLNLDADVNQYLNTFQIKETYPQPVTLQHIFTHTAGFEDGGIGYLITDDIKKSLPLQAAMKRYQPERVNPPGAQSAYSNYATSLAGLIVSNISGMSFEDYIQEHIFDPLGMKNASFVEPLPAQLQTHMAESYGVENGAFVAKPFEILRSFGSAGGLSATSTDMVRFAQAMLNGGILDGNRILKASTVEKMFSPQFSHDKRLMGMGLGFYADDFNGNRVVGHAGDLQWFHSLLGIDQQNQLTYFVSFGGPGGATVRSSFATSLYDEYFPVHSSPPVPPSDFSDRADKFTGSYDFWRHNFSTLEKALALFSTINISATADNTLMVTVGGVSKQYVEVEENLFREVSRLKSLPGGMNARQLAFQENSEGEVTGFVFDGMPFMSLHRLPFYATQQFHLLLVGLSLLIMLAALLRRFYQREAVKSLSTQDKAAVNASAFASFAHIFVVVAGVIVLPIAFENLFDGIPLLLKSWLVLPIIATGLSAYLLYHTILVWRGSLLNGLWSRVRFTVTCSAALFMSWFFYYWNILGFQYY